MDRILRSTLPLLVMSFALLACTSSATGDGSEPVGGRPSAEPPGVTLVLVAAHGRDGCCRVFTINPTQADTTVACGLVALNPAGRLIYSGVVPARLPGHLRSIVGLVWRSVVLWMLLLALLSLANLVG